MFEWISKYFRRSVGISDLFGSVQSAGILINEQSALSIAAVWRSLDLISSLVAKTDLITYRRIGDNKERFTQHKWYRPLKKQPNPLYSAFTLKKTMTWQSLLHGNSFAWIGDGELILLNPMQTTLRNQDGNYHYETMLQNTPYKIPFEDVLHLKSGLSNDGLNGMSLIQVMRDVFSEAIQQNRHANAFFKNGMRPGLAIELPVGLRNDEQIQEYRKGLEATHSGAPNHFRTLLLKYGAKAVPLQLTNKESEFIAQRHFSAVQVANLFGLPPHYLGENISTSFASLEQQSLDFLRLCLDPHLTAWETECEQKLLLPSEQDSVFFEFNRESLIQMDTTAKINAIVQQVSNGILNRNEGRALLNLPAIPDGETYVRPANLTPIGQDKPLADLFQTNSLRCGGEGSGIPGVCPSLNKLQNDSGEAARTWAGFAKELPAKVATAAKNKVANTYAKLEARYGRKFAVAIIGAGLLGVPLPLPGSSFLTAAPVIAMAELHRAFTRDDSEMDVEEIISIGNELMKELLDDWIRNDLPSLITEAVLSADCETLQVNCEELQAELKAILPEQIQSVIDRYKGKYGN